MKNGTISPEASELKNIDIDFTDKEKYTIYILIN